MIWDIKDFFSVNKVKNENYVSFNYYYYNYVDIFSLKIFLDSNIIYTLII